MTRPDHPLPSDHGGFFVHPTLVSMDQPRQPLVERVAASLRTMIGRQRLQPGSRLLSERQLGEQLHVSRSAVRNALHRLLGEGLVANQGGAWHVRRGSAEPATTAPVLLLTGGQARPVVDQEHPDLHSQELYRAAFDRIQAAGLDPVSWSVAGSRSDEVERALELKPRAVLVAGDVIDQRIYHRLAQESALPTVVFGDVLVAEHRRHERFLRVDGDQGAGAEDAMAWLAAKGVRSAVVVWLILHPPHDQLTWSHSRLAGYRRGAQRHGIRLRAIEPVGAWVECPKELRLRRQSDLYLGLLHEHLTGPEPVQAVLTTNDEQILWATDACLRLGRHPGRDVLLVGADHTWRYLHRLYAIDLVGRDAELYRPSATIDHQASALGQAMADLLIARLDGTRQPKARRVPSVLVES